MAKVRTSTAPSLDGHRALVLADEVARERDDAFDERHAGADVTALGNELPVGRRHADDHHLADMQIARGRDRIEAEWGARRRIVDEQRTRPAERGAGERQQAQSGAREQRCRAETHSAISLRRSHAWCCSVE